MVEYASTILETSALTHKQLPRIPSHNVVAKPNVISAMPEDIKDSAFRSERLVYRAIDDDLDAPLRNRFANMPRVEGFLSGKVLIPSSLEETTEYLARSQNLVA